MEQFKTAIVYGKSVKHQPQRVGLGHELSDEDVGKFWPEVRKAVCFLETARPVPRGLTFWNLVDSVAVLTWLAVTIVKR